MLSQKQKLITVFIGLIVLLFAVFLVFSFENGKLFFLKSVNRKNTEKILSDRKQCEDNFVFDEAKFDWASKNGHQLLLKKYAFCEAGARADYEYCLSGILTAVESDKRNCQKIVTFKKVFIPLLQKEKSPQDVVGDFEYFQSVSPDSPISKLSNEKGISSGQILNYFANKDGLACEGLEKKEPCLAFFTGDAKYCQDLLLDKDKNSCMNEVIVRQAIESQNLEKCQEINDQDDDGLLHVICESIVNKDSQFCSSNREYLGDFIDEYCKIENPLPI